MAELNFDSGKVDPIGTFEPLPIGDYLVVISASEKKDAKSGKGQLLQLTLDVVDGEYKGRKIFERLNVVNENPTAQEIAQRALAAICYVTGVAHPRMSEELHGKPFMVKVGIRPAKGEYSESNTILEYKYSDGRRLRDVLKGAKKAETTAPTAAETPAASGAAAPRGKRPWENK